MSSTPKVLVPSKTAENSQTTQYIANGVYAIIDKATALNYGAANAKISVNLISPSDIAGSQNLITKTKTLLPGEVYTFPEIVGHGIQSGGSISTLADTASSISIRFSGREVS